MSETKQQWWGYRHANGSIQAKRYYIPLDVQEAEESEFCETVFQPFEAESKEEAISIIKGKIRESKEKQSEKDLELRKKKANAEKEKAREAFEAGRNTDCEFDQWYNENH